LEGKSEVGSPTGSRAGRGDAGWRCGEAMRGGGVRRRCGAGVGKSAKSEARAGKRHGVTERASYTLGAVKAPEPRMRRVATLFPRNAD
jgi:hypothetical protein